MLEVVNVHQQEGEGPGPRLGKAQATVNGQVVVRKLELLGGGELQVTDTMTPGDGQPHELAVRWQGLGGLTPAEDGRGTFAPSADGGCWQDATGVVCVQVTAAGGQKPGLTSDLQYDGLAYGVLKKHRSLRAAVKGPALLELVSRVWVGPPGKLPPWSMP